MTQYLHTLLDLISSNPSLALAAAFLVAASEAILFIGLFVPSTVVLVGMGGLIGLGKLPFWPIFIVTTLGAAAGDQLSYWIGHIYKGRIANFSSSERYQGLLAAGRQYFARHGGASVAIGRFIPGVKSVVPAIAGMTSMPLGRFAVLNLVSACAWAAVHLLPGLSAGWTLTNYAQPGGRLDETVEIAVLVLVTALIAWAVRLIVNRHRPTPLKFER